MRWILSPFILWWHSHLATTTRHISPFELTVNSGAIRGERLLIDGQDYTVFKGIPFAMPPVGYLRFQGSMPKEPAKWRGVMNATQYSAMCMQNIDENDAGEPERYVAHVSEDCLYLNVFSPTPYQYTNDTYPVIVFIHGGRFQTGSGSDIPQRAILSNFVSRKASIVFVTFNYRLGPLGFASTGDSVLPGNIGLWDQIWALKWVKANAEVFGGDPSNILLMGHGTGAASASLLALSPRAEGLFQKVLLMSGSALQPGVVRNTQVNATWNMNDRFGCRAFNSSELLDCARKRSKEEIFQYKRLHYDDYEEFVPIIDGVGGVLPEPPEQLTLHRRKTPIVIGTTKDESSLRILLLNEKELNFSSITWEHGEKLAENLTMSYKQFQNHRLISQGCKSEYVWTQVDPSFPESVLFNSLLKMYSHFWYDAPASQLATYYLKHDLPVYLYSFDHISENFYDIDRAFHGVDKLHIFNVTPRFLNKRKDMNWQLDQRVVEIFSELVANFALYGTPTHENDGFSFNWTTTTAKELSYLSITDSPSMQVGYRWQGHVFWNWYARSLDAVDVGNIQRIAQLDRDVGNWQFATAMLSFCSLFFFAILVGLACYCTRKESDEDEL
ncbi:Protein CBG10957 [Caenorhabditis briggsae]|uniref:Protein CBG10957 n=2 Tax=Caenorhabditis briggsae TaxID=6238 RepID=A8XBY0_CAEBR|nr:Protein CBG10957 [Caenorhabditis briggsae]CAP30219.2 Protein CBG10957 [Caenorhabditis briggsae]